jgi:hypothetical protein
MNRMPSCRLAPALLLGMLASFPAFAQDAARIGRLESEIQVLRSQLDEQNRRIQRLEAQLAGRSGAAAVGDPQPKRRVNEMRTDAARSTAPQPWHAAAAWDRIGKGMTVEEVEAILGSPTATEAVDDFRTLFYRGTTPAGRAVDGLVNFREDRVVAVRKPEL